MGYFDSTSGVIGNSKDGLGTIYVESEDWFSLHIGSGEYIPLFPVSFLVMIALRGIA
jgi:hypothetical protein